MPKSQSQQPATLDDWGTHPKQVLFEGGCVRKYVLKYHIIDPHSYSPFVTFIVTSHGVKRLLDYLEKTSSSRTKVEDPRSKF